MAATGSSGIGALHLDQDLPRDFVALRRLQLEVVKNAPRPRAVFSESIDQVGGLLGRQAVEVLDPLLGAVPDPYGFCLARAKSGRRESGVDLAFLLAGDRSLGVFASPRGCLRRRFGPCWR